jgi:hypothetical protein
MANVARNKYDTIKSKPLRFPGRWYDPSYIPRKVTTKEGLRRVNAVQLIMETSWGVQRLHEQKCTYCAKQGYECWVLTNSAFDMVRNSTRTCARCRAYSPAGGCSFHPSWRKDRKRGLARLRGAPELSALNPNQNAGGRDSSLTIIQHPLMTNGPYAGNSNTGIQGNVGQEGSFNMHPYRTLRPRT